MTFADNSRLDCVRLCKETIRLARVVSSGVTRGTMSLRDIRERFEGILLGQPLDTSEMSHQTAPNPIALAVLASDALSSVAYATEEILIILNTAAISGFALLGFQ